MARRAMFFGDGNRLKSQVRARPVPKKVPAAPIPGPEVPAPQINPSDIQIRTCQAATAEPPRHDE